MPGLIPVAYYARYSSDNQRSESIDAQVRAIEAYCARKGFEIIAGYTDEALTATNDDRPQFQRMMRDSSRRDWKYIVVHKLDRFTRNKYQSAIDKHELKLNGVRVISVVENLDDSPESKMLESVLEGMAEYFSLNLSREVKKGLRENAYQGRLTGGTPPLGYDLDKEGHYIINEQEADTVRLIYQWYIAGDTAGQIAKKLNEMGRLTKPKRTFGASSIYDLIRNEKYKGVIVHGRYTRSFGDTHSWRRKTGDENTIRVEDVVPIIIDSETWNTANARMLRGSGRGKTHATRQNPLSGLIFCGDCQSPMEMSRAREQYSYRCVGKIKHTTTCSASNIDSDMVIGIVIDKLKNELLNKNSIKALVPNLRKAARKMADESKADSEALRDRMAELNTQAANLIDTIKLIGASSYIQSELVRLEDEKQKINRALIDADLRTVVYSSDDEELADLLYQDMDDIESGDDERIERVIRKYVQRVEVSFDPNDPPRKGHKRSFRLNIDAQIPRSMMKSRCSNGTSLEVPI